MRGKDQDTAARCECGHKWNSHAYIPLVGENSGRCLALKCDCPIYQETK